MPASCGPRRVLLAGVVLLLLVLPTRAVCGQTEGFARVRRDAGLAQIAHARRDYLATFLPPDSSMAMNRPPGDHRGGDPTPADVDSLAARTRRGMDSIFVLNGKTEKWLGLSLGAGTTVVKLGQYAGGGGAIVFGLNAASNSDNDKKAAGRNAAYSGAVAAAVTMLEQLFNLDEKKARAASCKDVDIRRGDLYSRTRLWEYKHNSLEFRRDTLPVAHDSLFAELRTLTTKCLKG